MTNYWTVCVLFMFVLNLVLGSDISSACDKHSTCFGNRPKRQDGCCPLLGGEQCDSSADQQCDIELGYNCTNGFCKGKGINISVQFNPFPNKPWFLRVCNTSLLKILWEKEKLLVTSNFSFSHRVFYPFRELSAIFIIFKIVVCKLFEFQRV